MGGCCRGQHKGICFFLGAETVIQDEEVAGKGFARWEMFHSSAKQEEMKLSLAVQCKIKEKFGRENKK